jgi:hypothetical protein
MQKTIDMYVTRIVTLSPAILKLKLTTTAIRGCARKFFTFSYIGTPVSVLLLVKWKLQRFFFPTEVGFVYIAQYARKPRKSSFYSPNSSPAIGRQLLTV